jgi:hypothetical protein
VNLRSELTDENGRVIWSADYDVYGRISHLEGRTQIKEAKKRVTTESSNASTGTTILKLGEVLSTIRTFKWNYALYIGGDFPFEHDSPCAVLDPNDSDDPDLDPDFAIQHDLEYALSVQQAQDVVENAMAQKKQLDIEDILEAFNFYYENDAFIKF